MQCLNIRNYLNFHTRIQYCPADLLMMWTNNIQTIRQRGISTYLLITLMLAIELMISITLFLSVILVHASVRLRSLKNKVENKLESIGLKRTPMGLLLEALGQEQEAGS